MSGCTGRSDGGSFIPDQAFERCFRICQWCSVIDFDRFTCGNLQRSRLDCQGAGDKPDIRKVSGDVGFIQIKDHMFIDLVFPLTHEGLRAFRVSESIEEIAIRKAVYGHIHTFRPASFQWSTVIDFFCGWGGEGDRRIVGCDNHAAVRHIKCDVEIAVVIFELACIQTHAVGSGDGSLCGSLSAESEVRFRIALRIDGNPVSFGTERFAGILFRYICTGNGDGDFPDRRLCDLQRTEVLSDGIVGRICGVPPEPVGVPAGANFRLGSGRLHADGFVSDQTCHLNVTAGERCAVVFLFCGAGSNAQDRGLNSNLAVRVGDVHAAGIFRGDADRSGECKGSGF